MSQQDIQATAAQVALSKPRDLDRKWMTAREVADTFRCTLRTLWNWDKAKVLVPTLIRKRRYYSREAVDALLKSSINT